MDARVDNDLGDSITYTIAGVPTVLNGYLKRDADNGGIDGIQPLNSRWFAKIRRSLLPADGPKQAHTLESPKLDGRYRPGPTLVDDDPDYWVFDLQRAP